MIRICLGLLLMVSLFMGIQVGLSAPGPQNDDPAHSARAPEQSESDQRQTTTRSLSWDPPPLEAPITIDVPADATRRVVLELDANRDYIINMPDTPLQAGVSIVGGRNIVMIGGEIQIPWQGDDASIGDRRMLRIRESTGIVHIEGLLGGGADISEGIQIDAPDAIVQLQNIRIDGIHARDQDDFSDNHPDLIQTYGNVRELRIDGLTGSSDYQGIFLSADFNEPHGPVIARRINIIGLPTARYLWWVMPEADAGTVTVEDVWIDVPVERWGGGLGKAVWPDVDDSEQMRATIHTDPSGQQYATWPATMSPRIIGRVHEGRPPGGDFVPAGSVGIGYERAVNSNE